MSTSINDHPEMGSSEEESVKMGERLRLIESVFPYPATPDLAGRERQRLLHQAGPTPQRRRSRLAVGLALVFLALAAALLVSPARARVLDWIRIGAVRIFFTQPTPTTIRPTLAVTPSAVMRQTPSVTPTPLRSVLDLAGQTNLASAQEQAGFTIQVPEYPPDLGAPDQVFLQNINSPIVVLVWMDESERGQVLMSLFQSNSKQVIFEKYDAKTVQDTRVGDSPAVWVDGAYLLMTRSGDVTFTRMINQSHTLIWNTGERTFRLETDVDLESAIRIAESIR